MTDTQLAPPKKTFFGRLRSWFLTGLVVSAPVFFTLYITWVIIDVLDSNVVALLPDAVRKALTVWIPGFGVWPGFGLIIGFVIITIFGAFAAGFFGRFLIRLGEGILNRMPIVRSIYAATKQILETVMASQSDAFRDVVLVEYPRKGLWVIGFVTGATRGEVQAKTSDSMVNIFVPTTPNPTSGFLLFCPAEDLTYLDMSVEEALKLVVSGGIVTPPHKAKATKKLPNPLPKLRQNHSSVLLARG